MTVSPEKRAEIRRAHFVDQLSARQLANLEAALASVHVDQDAAAGGCDNV